MSQLNGLIFPWDTGPKSTGDKPDAIYRKQPIDYRPGGRLWALPAKHQMPQCMRKHLKRSKAAVFAGKTSQISASPQQEAVVGSH
ncbi:hypothetical protein GCM10009077_35590 [Roseibium denhamense]|uniref:Uncharacterized protein n=1 Tax=Roseibium denhamense TaxID=76305 RepID=A0ABY1PD39_9HYPH|nr:hypothetical protein SAMN06265374_3394 [Roseibium denhamense]